jgi:hypothetical protein
MQYDSRTILDSADFYLRESSAILPKLKTAITPEEQRELLGKLEFLRQKIAFEIRQIDRAIENFPSED